MLDPIAIAESRLPGSAAAIRSFALPPNATLRDFLTWHEELERDFIGIIPRAQRFAADANIRSSFSVVAKAVADSQSGLRIAIGNTLLGFVPSRIRTEILSRIPTPPVRTLAPTPRLSNRGVGVAPVVIVAGVILAVLAAGGLLYLLARSLADVAHQVAGAYIARLRLRQFQELLETRERIYRECLAQGGTPTVCQTAAEHVAPTPRDAGSELDMPTAPGAASDSGGFPWLTIAVVIGVAGLGYYLWSRGTLTQLFNRLRASGTDGLGSAKYFGVRLPADTSRSIEADTELPEDTYNMEV